MTDELQSLVTPPSSLAFHEDEEVSNGFVPDVRTGFNLGAAIRSLAGATRSHGLWLGGYDTWTLVGPTATYRSALVSTFPLKPWVRDVVVNLVYEYDVDLEGVSIGVQIESGGVTKTASSTENGSAVGALFGAFAKSFLLSDVGALPGQAGNYDPEAIIRVIPVGANARLFSLTVEQLHTSVISQG